MPAYSYLKDDIINTIENNSTEFSDHIPSVDNDKIISIHKIEIWSL